MERSQRLALLQGSYFAVTGAWPLISMGTFEAITGPKRERWLVKTVGALALSVGVSLLRASRTPASAAASKTLGASTAVAFASIDLWYGGKGRISPVYLLDGVVELAFLAAWVATPPQPRARPQASGPKAGFGRIRAAALDRSLART